MYKLKATRLAKDYNQGQLTAFSNVSFSVKPNEFVCIIGPNGSGKSSLLKVLANITPPTAGQLQVTDSIAYLPQQPSLLPWRTVKQNIDLPLEVDGDLSRQDRTDITKLLKDFDLLDFADYYPKALSGGMQQKVALLRAVVSKPQLLLLDEPYSALDAITRISMQNWLQALWQKRQSAIVCVTHDIREAIFLADTIYVFSEQPGRIKQKLQVNLPRPRNHQQLASTTALKLEKQLRDLLIS